MLVAILTKDHFVWRKLCLICHGNSRKEKLDELRCFCFLVVLVFVQLDFNGCFGYWEQIE